MTSKEFSAIGKQLKGHLPGFTIRGPLIFKCSPQEILLGLHFGRSSFDAKQFHLSAFFLPLFVPTDTIHFTFGNRILNESRPWKSGDPSLIAALTNVICMEAMPLFNRVSTMHGAVEFLRAMIVPNGRGYVNPRCQEALAYTLVKLGNIEEALATLEEMQNMLATSTVTWELQIKARGQMLREALARNPEAAIAQLEAWKDETTCKLELGNSSLRSVN
jgi:hypothetical protein